MSRGIASLMPGDVQRAGIQQKQNLTGGDQGDLRIGWMDEVTGSATAE